MDYTLAPAKAPPSHSRAWHWANKSLFLRLKTCMLLQLGQCLIPGLEH